MTPQEGPETGAVLAVAANPALDVTYRLPVLSLGSAHRVQEVSAVAGGKAVNVARVLAGLGHPVSLTGFAAGPTGHQLRDGVTAAGIADHLLEVEGDTRRTVAVVDDGGRATGLWEPGTSIAPGDWARLTDKVTRLAAGYTVAVLSGSLPPGAPPDGYAELVAALHDAELPVVVDADGDALRLALPSRPEVVKPNGEELQRVAAGLPPPASGPAPHRGRPPLPAATLAAARALLQAGAGTVVASSGPDGLAAVTADRVVVGRPPETVVGNPTGAGDAAVAAIARGLAHCTGWPAIVADALALSAAAVACPVAGAISMEHYQMWAGNVHVEEVEL